MIYIKTKIGITGKGLEDLQKQLNDFAKRQVPYAIKTAINATAKQVQEDLKREIRSTFRDPVPFTQRSPYISSWAEKAPSVYIQPASVLRQASIHRPSASAMSATVKINDRESARGTPPSQYLAPQVFGGRRGPKRFERALQRSGILPAGYVTAPGKRAPRDGYGNIPGGVYGGMLLALGAGRRKHNGRRNAGQTDIAEKTSRYFVGGQPGTRAASLPPGIYLRSGRDAIQVVVFVKDANYQPRFDFFGVARRSVEKHFERNFHEAFAKALRTAR